MAHSIALNFGRLLRSSNCFSSLGRIQQSTMAEHPIKEITFNQLKDSVASNKMTLIDVREPNELKNDGKIPNSVNIPMGQIIDAFQLPESSFEKKYGIPKPDQSECIVISCRSGKRATKAFNMLLPLGFKNALVYSGSFQDWVENGGDIEK